MRTCAVIPVYNHGQAIPNVVKAVREQGLSIILVDDGSSADCAYILDQLCNGIDPHLSLIRLPKNMGKGGAMIVGLQAAHRQGFSHALQIDADGQHNTQDIPHFIKLSKDHPEALICGCPIYDLSVPKARFYGRYATHVWVWINTLSFEIKDAMCGFRIYPLLPVMALLEDNHLGLRMDFDIEILVRLHWRALRIVNVPTKVHYPTDGISHFKTLRDNLQISRMHAKLFVGMLLRLPVLLWQKVQAR